MALQKAKVDTQSLVDGLNFAEKVDRALELIREAHEEFGDRLPKRCRGHALGWGGQ